MDAIKWMCIKSTCEYIFLSELCVEEALWLSWSTCLSSQQEMLGSNPSSASFMSNVQKLFFIPQLKAVINLLSHMWFMLSHSCCLFRIKHQNYLLMLRENTMTTHHYWSYIRTWVSIVVVEHKQTLDKRKVLQWSNVIYEVTIFLFLKNIFMVKMA